MSLWTTGETITASKLNQKEVFISDTAPSSPVDGQMWYDTTEEKLKQYNATTSSWNVYIRDGDPVGIMDASDARINPAKEDGNLASIKTDADSIDSKLRTPVDAVYVNDVSVGTTAVQLDTDTQVRDKVTILADSDNSDTVKIGNSSSQLFPLVAGSSLTLGRCSLSSIYAIAVSGTQTLHVIGGGY